jgi:hypothetical protein
MMQVLKAERDVNVVIHILTKRHDDVVDKSCCCWNKEVDASAES